MRILLIIIGILLFNVSSSQTVDSCLTSDFSKMKSKKRIKIAQQESKESELDIEFQSLMSRGDSLFRFSCYKEALLVYKEARKRRPHNVYPKIKIQDLNGLILEELPVVVDIESTKKEETIEVRYTERSFYEGISYITERTVVNNDGKIDVYRRVINRNTTFYFLNGIVIDSRFWKKLTSSDF